MDTGPGQVRIRIHTVGVCGSDVHYYTPGKIGPFVVNEPMVLGHEAAGTVVEVGAGVTHLKVGDRVCMEPGIPDPNSRASRLGMYNVDPAVTFWATPPIHGVLTPEVVHPANYTYKLPDNVSFAEGAMVGPFAVGMQAAAKAKIVPGDTAVVLGAGPIGTMVAIAALAGGCAPRGREPTLPNRNSTLPLNTQGVIPVNIHREESHRGGRRPDGRLGGRCHLRILRLAERPPKPSWNCHGRVASLSPLACRSNPIGFDVSTASTKKSASRRYSATRTSMSAPLRCSASGRVDLKPLISETFTFEDSIKALRSRRRGTIQANGRSCRS